MLFKTFFLLFITLYYSLFFKSFSKETHNFFDSLLISNLKWEYKHDNDLYKKLNWHIDDSVDVLKKYNQISKFKNSFNVYAIGRAITVNGFPYPEISNYVPNAYVEDWQKTYSLSFRGISKTRSCVGKNFADHCADGVLDFDFNLINTENFSFNPKFNIQSLGGRKGSKFGEGVSMGFKTASKISPKWSIAVGGENIIHFDDTIDLGRNFYIMTSTYYPLGSRKDRNPSILFINAGIGSDFYGYRGNGFLGSTYCFGSKTLTGEGNDNCNWGPITSIAYAFNDRIAIVSEWFGYGYGTGISMRPFAGQSINISLYLTDFIKGFPQYIQDSCEKNNCESRIYGSVSINY